MPPTWPARLATACGPRTASPQTGTGKTYTMEGENMRGEHRGIIPRAIEDIFSYIQNDGESVRSKFLVRASYLQASPLLHAMP